MGAIAGTDITLSVPADVDLTSLTPTVEIAFPAAGLSCCCSLSFLVVAGIGLFFALSSTKKTQWLTSRERMRGS